MVSSLDEEQLNRLENQVENGGGGSWEYLCLIRKTKVRRSVKVLKFGMAILHDQKQLSKLGNEKWTLYEQVAIAAMDSQNLDVAKDCVQSLQRQFPGSSRVGRLEGMLFEASGSWGHAEKIYRELLEKNPVDQVVLKRKVAIAKAQGNLSNAIESLNKYLEIYMADHDAWKELAEIYTSLQMYKQAAFCYEELILCQPNLPLYHLAYAEVLYTLGGLENLQLSRKYFASTIDLSGGKNTRALYGICLCSCAINQFRGRNKEDSPVLQSLAMSVLLKEYKHQAPDKVPLLLTALQDMKISS